MPVKDSWPEIEKVIETRLLRALVKSAIVVETEAVFRCPVDSGQLRNSINSDIDGAALVAKVGTPVEHAVFVEYGTGKYAENGQGRKTPWAYVGEDGVKHWTWGGRPYPFLRPAGDNNKERIEAIFVKELKL